MNLTGPVPSPSPLARDPRANPKGDVNGVNSDRMAGVRKYRSFILGSANASYPILCCRSRSAPVREESAISSGAAAGFDFNTHDVKAALSPASFPAEEISDEIPLSGPPGSLSKAVREALKPLLIWGLPEPPAPHRN